MPVAAPVPRWSTWLRSLLCFGVVVVALSILGMHQLSLDHALVTPTTGPTHGAMPALTLMDGPDMLSLGPPEAFDHAARSGQHGEDGRYGEEPCPAGCHDHPLTLAACVLALTLLVAAWRLRPPTLRDRPRFLFCESPIRMPMAGRRPPALTLGELSVCRT